jgi:hypothetical protein
VSFQRGSGFTERLAFAGELYLKALLHDVDGDQRATDSDEDR